MALLSAADQQTLRGMFDDMKQPVTLLFFTQAIECETCDETKRILAELTEVTDKIVVEEVNLVLDKERAATYGIERAPALVLLTNGQDTRIRFFGAPAGYDFMAMVDAILAASGASDSDLSDESVALVSAVTEPTRIQVFVTPTCVYCPRAVALANRLAVASPLISATAYSVIEFPDLIRRHRVTGVPKIVFDTGVELLGAQPEDAMVDAVLTPR